VGDNDNNDREEGDGDVGDVMHLEGLLLWGLECTQSALRYSLSLRSRLLLRPSSSSSTAPGAVPKGLSRAVRYTALSIVLPSFFFSLSHFIVACLM
jgi:hypothetical protein